MLRSCRGDPNDVMRYDVCTCDVMHVMYYNIMYDVLHHYDSVVHAQCTAGNSGTD